MSGALSPMPRFVPLTPDKEAKITELEQLMRQTYNPLPALLLRAVAAKPGTEALPTTQNVVRLYCYAFLQSREWDVQKAYTMMKTSVKFREDSQMDTCAYFPSCMSVRGWDEAEVRRVLQLPSQAPGSRLERVAAGIYQHFSCGFHYWDKNGLPVLYLVIGNVDEAGLLKKLKQMANIGQTPTDVFWELLQHSVGVGECLGMFNQRLYDAGSLPNVDASEGLIRASTIILDLKGLNYKMLWKPALDLFMGALSILFKNFPDCVHRIVGVNAPSMVTFAYKIVKGVLPVSVQKKVHFVSPSETPAAMLSIIQKEYVPYYLGGECRCNDFCVAHYDAANPARTQEAVAEVDESVVTENISLSAGNHHERVFSLKCGESVVWEFSIGGGHDVKFMVYFVPALYEKQLDLAKVSQTKLLPFLTKSEPLSEGSDSYAAAEDGAVVLMWDNKSSWLKSKDLQMKVYVTSAEV